MIYTTLQNRIKEIDTLLLTADGEAHDALCEEHDSVSERIYDIELEDEEYASNDHAECVRQAYAPQQHRL